MNFIIVISGPVSLETIFCSQRCTTDDLLPKFLQHPIMMQKRERKKQGNLKPVQGKMWRKKELI